MISFLVLLNTVAGVPSSDTLTSISQVSTPLQVQLTTPLLPTMVGTKLQVLFNKLQLNTSGGVSESEALTSKLSASPQWPGSISGKLVMTGALLSSAMLTVVFCTSASWLSEQLTSTSQVVPPWGRPLTFHPPTLGHYWHAVLQLESPRPSMPHWVP